MYQAFSVSPTVFFVGTFEVIPETVGQFIGLLDEKATRIFEGDLVLVNHPEDVSGDFTDSIQRVFYWEPEGKYVHTNGERPPKCMWEFCTVTGNIHDETA